MRFYSGWFDLATRIGLPLQECMERTTNRAFRTWLVKMDEEWNIPDRHDNYIMMVACEVCRVLMKNKNAVQPKDFKLKFEKPITPEKLSMEEATRRSKITWLGSLMGAAKAIASRKRGPKYVTEAEAKVIDEAQRSKVVRSHAPQSRVVAGKDK